ncbi:hypothetical protein HaLaN_22459 [Haematococcus lacustris]|uniref:Uncharacterized protein n=1 Tax=Haematococcus lacustris TaxID=44745 RepID=A0A699ZTW1_HAELA|nr:hypothetical protein HaLaN_22459 [Haematococcus lacustris]
MGAELNVTLAKCPEGTLARVMRIWEADPGGKDSPLSWICAADVHAAHHAAHGAGTTGASPCPPLVILAAGIAVDCHARVCAMPYLAAFPAGEDWLPCLCMEHMLYMRCIALTCLQSRSHEPWHPLLATAPVT